MSAKITKYGKDIIYCPECEACWDSPAALASTKQLYGLTFTDLKTLLEIHNLSYSDVANASTE